jgi:hypothetical protein
MNEPAVFRLDEFKVRFGFSADELEGELYSGRLRPKATHDTFSNGERTGKVKASDFIIDNEVLHKWTENPETPKALINKFFDPFFEKPKGEK